MINTTLKRTRALSHMSIHKLCQLNSEVLVREALCWRCGGRPDTRTRIIRMKGVKYTLATVHCIGGLCEYCHLPSCYPDKELHPHEEPFRSAGGRVSLEGSKMACACCHEVRQKRLDFGQAVRLVSEVRQVSLAQAKEIIGQSELYATDI